uniref:Uncharacterized protein n=1 Tax=Romanomermis culicivorax TaxID=13658 RepID=A0A915KHL4_ROMCU
METCNALFPEQKKNKTFDDRKKSNKAQKRKNAPMGQEKEEYTCLNSCQARKRTWQLSEQDENHIAIADLQFYENSKDESRKCDPPVQNITPKAVPKI